jgi:hypothetical protein
MAALKARCTWASSSAAAARLIVSSPVEDFTGTVRFGWDALGQGFVL